MAAADGAGRSHERREIVRSRAARSLVETPSVKSRNANRYRVIALATVLVAVTVPVLAQPAISWVLSYENKSTNQFAHDARTATLVNNTVPAKLAPRVLDALGGPPNPVFVREKRYLSASACVPHNCTSKGFFWIDTSTGAGLGAQLEESSGTTPVTLTIGSNTLSASNIPAAARDAVVAWIADTGLTPRQAAFMDTGGVTTAIDAGTPSASRRANIGSAMPWFQRNIVITVTPAEVIAAVATTVSGSGRAWAV